MLSEIRVYVINCDESKINFFQEKENFNYEAIMDEAERQGNVYSIEGFENAINNDELYLDNSYIFIR